MTSAAMTTLITDNLALFAGGIVAILTAVIAIGVAYLVFRFGWRKVKGATK